MTMFPFGEQGMIPGFKNVHCNLSFNNIIFSQVKRDYVDDKDIPMDKEKFIP